LYSRLTFLGFTVSDSGDYLVLGGDNGSITAYYTSNLSFRMVMEWKCGKKVNDWEMFVGICLTLSCCFWFLFVIEICAASLFVFCFRFRFDFRFSFWMFLLSDFHL
jgi:hypothetical protein